MAVVAVRSSYPGQCDNQTGFWVASGLAILIFLGVLLMSILLILGDKKKKVLVLDERPAPPTFAPQLVGYPTLERSGGNPLDN